MEDYKDLIVLALVVAFSVLGSLSKRKKQAKARQAVPHPAERMPEEPWDWQPQEAQPPVPQEWRRDEVHAPSISFKENMNHSQYREDNRSEKIMLNTKPAPDTYADESKQEVAGDFDLRQAVIYSEILKPKFKEF